MNEWTVEAGRRWMPGAGAEGRVARWGFPKGALLVGLGCYASALLARWLLVLPAAPGLSILWPPNFVLMTGLLAAPVSAWPALTLAAYAASLAAGVGPTTGATVITAMFVGDAAQALATAAVLRPLHRDPRFFETLRGTSHYLGAAAVLGPALGALVSLALLSPLGFVDVDGAALYWRARFVTNLLTAIAVGPLFVEIVHWGGGRRSRFTAGHLLELAALVAGTCAAEWVLADASIDASFTTLVYGPLPFLVWASVRFGPAGLGVALLTATIARYVFGSPHLWHSAGSPADAVLSMQLVLTALALPLLLLSAMLRERERAHEDLRDSHARYGLAATAGKVGVWDWNLATGTIYVDPELKQLLGFGDSEIANRIEDWGSRVHPDDVDRVMKLAQDHIDGRSPIYEVEHRMVAKDGSVRWFLARGKVVERASGEALRMIGTDTDVTERKLAEQAVEEARFHLARLTRAEEMGEVAASIAHEVNQPICAIVTNARASLRWMDGGVQDNAELRSALEDIVADAKRASDIVERTRELFRRRRTSPQALSVNDLVQDVLRLMRGTLDEQGVSVETELAPELPDVPADPTQLRQVLFNLVLNAIEAMQDNAEGARRVAIRTGRDGEDRVEVAVSDNGSGLTPGGRARLFTPFFTTKPDGMGMGLAISRTIVEAHGGDLWATDGPERGASFHVVLPAS